jgi:hypothetical protein
VGIIFSLGIEAEIKMVPVKIGKVPVETVYDGSIEKAFFSD